MQTGEKLRGLVEMAVILADGSEHVVQVHQLPLKKFDKGFELESDEIALTAHICGKAKEWILELTPESYEAVRAKAWEVNEKGFFAYCDRQRKILYERLNMMNGNALRTVVGKVSSATPRASVPRPV